MQYWARVKDSLESEESRTEDVTATQDHSFEEFVLAKPLLQTLKRVGYKYPSPIQKEVIPKLLGGESVIARAKNGTGKTGAYAIPLMGLVDPLEQRLQAIVLVPTRELAVQTDAFLKEFGAPLHIASTCITGGESTAEDLFGLVICPQIVVGTPGRVVDFLTKGILGLEKLRVLVLDDADRLLENELRECIEPLVERVAGKAQVVALSATFPRSMECFINRYLSHAVTINTMHELALLGVQQYYDVVPTGSKITRLYVLIHALPFRQMIIFCNSNKRVMMVAQLLRKYKVPCLHIHAALPQETRLT
jgi:ATP-dependent RNA helicase DDX6/DHH1